MIVYILLKFCETEEGEVNYELSSFLLSTFIKHTRLHMQNPNNQCLQSVLFLHKILQNSRHLPSIAKDKDLLNFLFTLMPYLFREES